MTNPAVKIVILALFLVLPLRGEPQAFPPAETTVKNDVDHWGLGFADQFDTFTDRFQKFSEKTGKKSPDYLLGVESPLRKTFKNKYWFKGQVATEVQLYAGRNESEAFQLAVLPKTGFVLNNIKIAASSLKATGGKNEIPAQSFTLSRVGFVRTVQPPYPTCHVGEWPDPLLELAPFSLGGLDLGLVWCEIKIPRDTPPGDYLGTLTVTASNARPQTLTIKLHVWNFTLPNRVPFPTMAWIAGKMDSKEYLETCRLFLAHHVDPISVGQTTDLNLLDKNLEFCISRGLMRFQTPDLSKFEDFRPYYDHLKKKGWLDKALIYGGFDEPPAKIFYDQVVPRTAMIRQEFPGLSVFLASQYYDNMGQGSDLWMTDLSTNFLSWLKAGRPGTQQLWWYFCHLPIHVDLEQPLVNAPNMLIDNDAVEHRLPYWMAGQYGVKGIFIYAGNHAWPNGIEVWPKQQPLPLTDKKYDFPYGGIHNGNGFLIYPGPRPSLRLKNLRDGIEDYWYLARLRELAASGPCHVEAQSLLNGLSPAIYVDPHYFNRDPDAILACRQKIGELIEKANP